MKKFNYINIFWLHSKINLKLKYKQSVIGLMWSFIKPTITIVTYAVIFGLFAKIDFKNTVPYSVYLCSGFVIWLPFSSCINDGFRLLTDRGQFIRNTKIPSFILAFSNFLILIIDLLTISIIFFILCFFFNFDFMSIKLLFIFFPFILLIILSLSLNLILSTMFIKFRDISHLIGIILHVGAFLTPIIYQIKIIPEKFLFFYELNPLVGIIEFFRWTTNINPEFNLLLFCKSLIIICLTVIISIFTYFKNKKKIAELL